MTRHIDMDWPWWALYTIEPNEEDTYFVRAIGYAEKPDEFALMSELCTIKESMDDEHADKEIKTRLIPTAKEPEFVESLKKFMLEHDLIRNEDKEDD